MAAFSKIQRTDSMYIAYAIKSHFYDKNYELLGMHAIEICKVLCGNLFNIETHFSKGHDQLIKKFIY